MESFVAGVNGFQVETPTKVGYQGGSSKLGEQKGSGSPACKEYSSMCSSTDTITERERYGWLD